MAGTARVAGFCQLHLQLLRRRDRLLFALAHDRDVVAFADDLHEAGQASNGGIVDADELRAGERRLHVTRVDHARQLHVGRPFREPSTLAGMS